MPGFLSSSEAAAELGITRQWLGQLVRMGEVPARVGSRNRYVFDPKDIAKFKRSHPSDNNPLPVKGAR